MTATALIRRATVEDIVSRRNRALTLYGTAYEAISGASAALVEAAKAAKQTVTETNRFNFHVADSRGKFLGHIDVPRRDLFMTEARRLTDTDAWAHLVTITDIERLMDKTAKDQFTQQLISDPPEVTVDNVVATLQQLAADANLIFKRGIAECFSKLDRRFRSHDGWKIGSRVILSYCFSDFGGWSYHSNHRDTLQDIERVFMVLDGREVPKTYAGIVAAVQESRLGRSGARQSEVTTEFFTVRGFKNGNAHVWFKRDDLVGKVNRLLGEYYGHPIPEEREPEDDGGLYIPKTTLAKNYGFYPTPDVAAEKLLDGAHLYRAKDDSPIVVLEPSAGTGHLARMIAAKGAIVDCVEVHGDRAIQLQRQGLYRKVTNCDFLRVEPAPVYDRVVMNPPFDRERDIDHVVHALKFLKADGFLSAIMSAGTEFRETRKSQAFRDLMSEMNARWADLPAGSFASVGTYCNTIILRVQKNGKAFWS